VRVCLFVCTCRAKRLICYFVFSQRFYLDGADDGQAQTINQLKRSRQTNRRVESSTRDGKQDKSWIPGSQSDRDSEMTLVRIFFTHPAQWPGALEGYIQGRYQWRNGSL
jgi:hypothetical protein